jgi:hypothetical protein
MRTRFRGLAVFTSQFLFFGLFALAQIGNSVFIAPAMKNPLGDAIVGAVVEIRDGMGAAAQVRPTPFDGHQHSPGAS